MKLTAQIKLLPSEGQADSLLETLERANKACQYISDYAHESGEHSKYKLQDAVYHDVRERYDLSAQMTVRALGKVADAYKTNPDSHNEFDIRGGFPYDSRILSFYTGRREVSIWTLGGREKISYEVGENHRALLEQDKSEADLIYRDGTFFLLVSCQMPTANMSDEDVEAIDGYLGVDRGVNNIATTSDGDNWTSDRIDDRRQWYQDRRSVLQSVGTRSAKRELQRLSGKQARFQRDTNHMISKRIVSKAKARSSAIALEDLSGIRERTTVRRQQRARHSNWSFYQLRQFIEYKALIAGVPVIQVDAAYTSRTCSNCGHCDSKNRNGSSFECRDCGHSMDADKNAARNIAARATFAQGCSQ
ncbi:MAG: RNA-guided endonuclease InsQ/TnpB family protein [Salinibacter sp.]|uniref:RNA-guided endonuclease InsQ/TnpB family protein n=1 Tax=Salinibacter sp. TaxID=2065818 RepID=UPI0035D5137C